jgi:septum formation protein
MMSQTTPPVILASGSPRRRDLLKAAGIDFDMVPPSLAEPRRSRVAQPVGWAEALAYFKARAVAMTHPDSIVLGADTLCVLDGEILGKARDADHAREILQRLSGTQHAVITGVAVCAPQGKRVIASETTGVRMRPMSDAEINAYIDSGEWIGKAGAYAIQETADRYVDALDGSFDNVVGLPVDLVRRMLTRIEYFPCGCEDQLPAGGAAV